MPRLHPLLAPLVIALALIGCSSGQPYAPFSNQVEQVLSQPDSLELLTLHPAPYLPEGKPTGAHDDFHGYRVLDRALLPDHDRGQELLGLVAAGVRDSDGTVAACFNPRHGLRVTRGADVVEFVICYECLSLDVHGPGTDREDHTTSSKVQTGIDRIFGAVGLKIHGRD